MKNLFKKILWPTIAMLLSFSAVAHAYTTTTNYSFKLPQVNNAIDQDQWGTYLNSNISSLDSLLLTASNSVHAAVSSNTVLDTTYQNKIVEVNASGGTVQITLPAVATTDGWGVTVKKIDSSVNAVTVKGASSDLIDGSNTYAITTQYDSFTFVTDGTTWQIKSAKYTPVSVTVKTIHQQIFTSNGTYTPTAGMVYAEVEELGGGGGGGGALSTGSVGAGGQAGTYSKSILSSATVGVSQAVTIGTGGTGGANTGGTGGTGGATSLGSLVTAPGGVGGNGATNGSGSNGGPTAGGTGAAAGTATFSVAGANGENSNFEVSSARIFGGGGANAGFYGAGGAEPTTLPSSGQVGNAGTGYGSGGGGASGISHVGGAGAPGIIIVTEYCSQ